MALATIKSRQYPEHYAQASGEAKPTAGVPYGATLYETDTALWYIFTAAGWVLETMPAIAATLPAGVDVNSIAAGTNNIGDVDVASLPGTVAADIGETKRQLTGPVLFPMSGAATHTISATAAQLISFVLQAANAGIITVKDGDTTLLTFAAGALTAGQAVFLGAMMTNPKIVFAGADMGVATYIPTAS